MADHSTAPQVPAAAASPPPTAPPTTVEPVILPTDVAGEAAPDVVVDDENDSALGGDDDDWQSDTTSLASAFVRGRMEHGRKYQTIRDGDYWGPSDEKQFNTMELCHILFFILDHEAPYQLFHAPVGDHPQNILDLGTGDGAWAIDIADKFPSANIVGVDLFPPPAAWVPSNCVFQVDDVTQPWTFRQKFDLIHMRLLYGAFSREETDKVYRYIYDNLEPGGWIEQVEIDVRVMCDDNSIPEGGVLAGWGPMFIACSERSGRPLTTQLTMRGSIEKVGFVNVQEKVYKCPLGRWPKDPTLKDAGRVNMEHWKSGLEGWAMWFLTKFGAPRPWSPEEVQVYVAQMRAAMTSPSVHGWHWARRVWAQKPKE